MAVSQEEKWYPTILGVTCLYVPVPLLNLTHAFQHPFIISVQAPLYTYTKIQECTYSRVYFIKEKGFQCQVIHGDAQGVCQRILKSASWPMHMTQQGVKMKKKVGNVSQSIGGIRKTVAAPRKAAPECQKGKSRRSTVVILTNLYYSLKFTYD